VICRTIFIFLYAIIILSGCTSQNRLDGYVYYRINANPTTLDPALIVDVTGGSISAKLFNGLVRIGDDLSIQPDLAETWTVSQDGLTYTFQIRHKVLFSNNQILTAHDVKYSFKRVLTPKTRSPQTWVLEKIQGAQDYMTGKNRDIEGLRVIDDHTIAIRLEEPFSPFLSLLTMTAAYIVPQKEVEKWGQDFSTHPVGTGPFVLTKWVHNQEIQLVRRDDYFDLPAHITGIIYRVIPEDLTAVTEFETGNIDVLTIPASEYSRYRNDPDRSHLIASMKGLNTYYLGFNCSKAPFNDPVLRKAIHYAIDREKILSTIYEKRGRLASGPVPDVMRTWVLKDVYTFDPDKSVELLKTAGVEDINIDFFVTADQEIIDIAEVIQSYLHDIDIDVNIKRLEWSAYKESIDKGEPDMFYLSWWADYPDPENFLFPLFHSKNFGPAGNRVRYQNSKVDSFVEKGQITNDRSKREAFYRMAEEIIVSDAPWVFLWHRTDFTVRQPWIKNYKIYPVYHMDKGTEISF
jgi:peptide/nickel transport system substrate-binding protein/oligopeptide transport system substrate-binding protein